MKKKLFLNRDTIRKLTTDDLHEVVGGQKSDNSACCTILPQIPENTFPGVPLLPTKPL
ncbi:MAG: class I lanthipeptide [Kofleriaceae bacterium]